MRNRATYRDFDLVFCREVRVPDNAAGELGWPLPTGILGQDTFQRLVKRAGVRRITFHGLRHTCATLLLGAGVPVKVVSERLGHSKITMTLDIYAHALPSMQEDAAVQLGSLMYG
jgi:integrase